MQGYNSAERNVWKWWRLVLDFRIEYYTQRADTSGRDEDGEEPKDPIGRILRIPLSLRFTASLQVTISSVLNSALYKILKSKFKLCLHLRESRSSILSHVSLQKGTGGIPSSKITQGRVQIAARKRKEELDDSFQSHRWMKIHIIQTRTNLAECFYYYPV